MKLALNLMALNPENTPRFLRALSRLNSFSLPGRPLHVRFAPTGAGDYLAKLV